VIDCTSPAIESLGIVPLGVTGNTPDSGSGESWFDPRRGNSVNAHPASSYDVACFAFRNLL
jgi:hypothetical protein